MILRSKICLFALITSLFGFALMFRHIAVGKLSKIRVDGGVEHHTIPHNSNETPVADHGAPDLTPEEGNAAEPTKVPEPMDQQLWENLNEMAHHPMYVKWDTGPVVEVCKATVWRDDLIFECLNEPDQVRANILACIRYAISAGAAIHIPPLSPAISSAWPFDPTAAFQITHLLDPIRFQRACPQLKIYTNNPRLDATGLTPIESAGPISRTPPLHPQDLPHWHKTLPVTSIANFARSIADQRKGVRTVIPFGPVKDYYPICTDGAEFADMFGRIVNIGTPVHHKIATRLLWRLKEAYGIDLKPAVMDLHPQEKNKAGFLGIRFETHPPITGTNTGDLQREQRKIPSYQSQRDYFIKRIRQKLHSGANFTAIYISAPRPLVSQFRTDLSTALDSPIPLLRPEDLLINNEDEIRDSYFDSAHLGKLEQQTQEGRDAVDYLVLLRAQYFLGTAESEVSWAVAVRRRTQTQGGSCGWRRGLRGWVSGSAMWDAYSDLRGERRYVEEGSVWP